MRRHRKDKFGPEYVIKVYDPKIGMEGFLVIDSTVMGPGKGGIRLTPNVNEEEVIRLDRTMTWKTALMDIPVGGAKAGIVWDREGSLEKKKAYIQSFARAIEPFVPDKYITAPDINTGEMEMQWFVEATGNWRSATGKPSDYCLKFLGLDTKKCGIPHETGSTGFGVAQSAVVAAGMKDIDIKGATVAIHGFGNVGSFTYRFLHRMGAKVVALADSSTAIYDKNGLDNGDLLADAFGRERVMVGMCALQGRVREPGVVEQLGQVGRVVFGEMGQGITARGETLLKLFEKSGWNVELSDNAMGAIWRKFIYLAGTAGINAITQAPYGEMRNIPETRELISRS